MKNKLIFGRNDELEILDSAFKSKTSEFIAVYGRRRIGKTYLIHHYCSSTQCEYFHVTGIRDGSYEDQILSFTKTISSKFYDGIKLQPPKNWLEAFEMLNKAIHKIKKNRKIALFFDEFPWMVTRRSRLLQVLEYYWNHEWAFEGRIKLIICGSSSSWIVKNIINNAGGLYNRVTQRIKLDSFNLTETKEYLRSKSIDYDFKQVSEIYMVMGGIPFYLSQIKKNYSLSQNINKIFFSKQSNLHNEYNLLLTSLFENSVDYDRLLRGIARYRYGVGQAELMKKEKIPHGGRTIERLKELEEVGFIQSFIPKDNKEKGKFYKVIDEYILFYIHWIEPNLKQFEQSEKVWQDKQKSASWSSWSGIAFEAICHKHIREIAKKLEIYSESTAYCWRFIPIKDQESRGAQIDLLFDRDDNAITLCEIKYTDKPFTIDKEYADKFKQKKNVFVNVTRTKKQIFFAIISASGIKENKYSEELLSSVVTLDDLFK